MFRVSDKVVCIDDRDWIVPIWVSSLPKLGHIYVIRGVFACPVCDGGIGVYLVGITGRFNPLFGCEQGFQGRRFRPLDEMRALAGRAAAEGSADETGEEMRQKIAEACGAKWLKDSIQKGDWWLVPKDRQDEFRPEYLHEHGEWQGNVLGGMKCLPDYLNSLDAMHEAEKVLTHGQREQYVKAIVAMRQSSSSTWWDCAHATALQRATAFILALNLQKP